MKLGLLIMLACTLMTLSACVVEPYGRDRGYYHGDRGEEDYGRRVWRE
jgi:hypothetical protein